MDITSLLSNFLIQLANGVIGGATQTTQTADGTSGAPAYSFASEPTLGIWRSSSGIVGVQGALSVSGGVNIGSSGTVSKASGWNLTGTSSALTIANVTNTIGSVVNVSALPTVASGFGTSPAVTTGSTPFAGSVNVGTGGVATSGVIAFNGTAFPSAPFVVCMNTTTGAVVRAVSSTTQLTITAPAAFTASDVICWICVSSK